MKRISLFLLLCILAIVELGAQKKQAPNVIIIFPDQYRQFSLGFWSKGNNAKYIQGRPDPVNTPNIDKLAETGIVFNRAMSNFPLCSPFRGMMLTGKYPSSNGLTANCRKDRDVEIKIDGKSIANIFSQAGYETAYFGKCHWHRTEPVFDKDGNYVGTTKLPGGHYVNRYDTYVPPGEPRLGFDYFFQTIRDTHTNPLCYSNDPKAINGLKDGELYMPHRFNAAVETEAILNYLENTHNQRDPEKPFFITWSLNPPHNPWTEEHTDMRFFHQYTYNGRVIIDSLLLRENADKNVGIYAPYYFANVSAVDFYIGEVLKKLDDLGETENTIILFTSDHGEMLGSHGYKGKPFPEVEVFNIPFILKWGNKLEHRIDDLMICSPDIMPTLLGMAGLEYLIPETVQGTNYADIIKNPGVKNVKRPRAVLYFDYTSRGLYTGKYTFVVKEDGNGKLKEVFYYDNEKDPYQLNRISGRYMNKKLVKWFKNELAKRLVAINDKWVQKKICADFLEY